MKVWNIYQVSKQDKKLVEKLNLQREQNDEIPVELDVVLFSGSKDVYIRGIYYNDINIKPFLSLASVHYYTTLVQKELEDEKL